MMIEKAIAVVKEYLRKKYTSKEFFLLIREVESMVGEIDSFSSIPSIIEYEEVQKILSNINEKEQIRKSKGVYYTPSDVVKFIVYNSFKMSTDKLTDNNIHVLDLNGIPHKKICFEKLIFDPTCGAGEFLLGALELKMDLLDMHFKNVSNINLQKLIRTIYGNDINNESIIITKLRLFLSMLNRYGSKKVIGIGTILNCSFSNFDYISSELDKKRYDIIIGNPPYVEDNKSGLNLKEKFGNIYANVLNNATSQLKDNGVLGFVIPLSYVSTLRMKKLRVIMNERVPKQYILSYSDRPDCLFTSVHQKLNIFLAQNKSQKLEIHTGNYTYWYKDEREHLFSNSLTIKNPHIEDDYIPKLGSRNDLSIYKKIKCNAEPISNLFGKGDKSLYLNMRAAFWIKAFLNKHSGSEYKKLSVSDEDIRCYLMCLFNSSIFWWYWISISDCWHITNKELNGFKVPKVEDFDKVKELAYKLEHKLEDSKVYVGTKQVDYEYKHRLCIEEIQEIDDYVNNLFGLTAKENLYIKNFALQYRMSGGVKK